LSDYFLKTAFSIPLPLINYHTMRTITITAVLIASIISSCSQMKTKVDQIIFSTKIYSCDDSNHVYQSVAIKDGKIADLGDNEYIFDHYSAPVVYNAIGKTVFPGFIDGHCHFFGYGINELRSADLRGTKSFNEVLEVLKKHYEQYQPDWLLGRGWDQNDWETKEWPDLKALDSLFPNIPVILKRIDGHAVFVNTKAISLSGLKPGSGIDGGEILTDINGRFIGVFIDNAADVFDKMVPPPSEKEMKEALLLAEEACFSLGLTSVVDAGLDVDTIMLIDSMQQAGLLRIKINAMLTPTRKSLQMVENGPYVTDRLTVRSVKLYADGALGSRGALLSWPYNDAPHKSGLLIKTPQYYQNICEIALKNNFQVNTHAIGDSAVSVMLDVYARFLQGHNDKRWRIEHAQIVNPDDIELFKQYSIIPSIQATHATSDMYWAADRLGDERILWAYAYKTLLAQNGWLINGTDFPIEHINPMLTFYASVARKDVDGYPEKGFQTENALSREDALKSMTIWAAKGSFEENRKGSIEKGKDADLVILSDNIMEMDENALPWVKVVRTIVNGEVVYKNPEFGY